MDSFANISICVPSEPYPASLQIPAVLLAVQLKGKGSEYGTYIVMAAGLCLFFYAAGKLEVILKTLRTMESCIGISPVYLSALLKMAGITYIAVIPRTDTVKIDIFYRPSLQCTLGVFPALAFAADFSPAAPEFHQHTPQKFEHN